MTTQADMEAMTDEQLANYVLTWHTNKPLAALLAERLESANNEVYDLNLELVQGGLR
ncbi:MAG: hypothetical protein GQ474_08020 [Sulfurimonas sp.]|nr:hypothetical protein [Sulfurimonas sp.]